MVRSATAAIPTRRLHLIDGQRIPSASAETFETRDPATGELLSECARAGAEDTDRAVAAARRALPAWSQLDPMRRTRLLLALADLIERNAPELAELESRDVGKPIAEATTRDLPFTVATWHYYAGWPTKIVGTTNPAAPGIFSFGLREPVGVCAVITPWNFPLTIASWKIAPALACGNTVVHKPAEEAPLTAIRLGELALEAGIPAGVLNVVTGDAESGRALAAHPDVDALSFTGSTPAGQDIQHAAAANLKRLTLELGGKSANIVLADADLDAAVRGAISSTFRNQGEICTAGARLIVDRRVSGELVERVAEHVRGIRLGHGIDPETQMGPLVSPAHRDHVLDLYAAAVAEGAQALLGGGQAAVDGLPDGLFVQPSIFTGTRNDMRINREEIFGPAVAVIEVDGPDEALAVANDTRYGLAAGVFTSDGGLAHRMARALRAGTVWINTYGGLDPYSTFSGRGLSGRGYELGPESIGQYTVTKTVKEVVGGVNGERLAKLDRAHVVHPHQAVGRPADPLIVVAASGAVLTDVDGRDYLDGTCGLWQCAVGHGRAELADVAREQMATLEFYASFWDLSNPPSIELAARLAGLAPAGLDHVFFTNGGSEGVETAIKLVRLARHATGEPERTIVLTRKMAYHGVGYGSLSATGIPLLREGFGPLAEGFVHLTAPQPLHMPDCTDQCVAELERTIAELGAGRITAMIGEPILGVAGMIPPPDDYWPRMSEVLRRHGIMLILDEIVTAYGRTGHWFAAERWGGIAADVIVTAKALTSGYLPLGAVLIGDRVMSLLDGTRFSHGFTYNGHPTCCAVALRNLDIIEREGLLGHAVEMGERLLRGLAPARSLAAVAEVRGVGLMAGIELHPPADGAELADRVRRAGVIVRATGQKVVLSPPLVITPEQVDRLASVLVEELLEPR